MATPLQGSRFFCAYTYMMLQSNDKFPAMSKSAYFYVYI